MKTSRAGGAALVLGLTLAAAAARAGPPYVTDDPEPTRTGGWENYVYMAGTNGQDEAIGQGGVELNYGAAPNLQLSASLPLDYSTVTGGRLGRGDLNLGVKYRFVKGTADNGSPDLAIFPAIGLPTGMRAVDTGHATLFLPLWMQKDFGKWSVFGGGGYEFNPGRGQRDFALSGIAVTRQLGPRLNLGMEFYHQTAASIGGVALTNLGFGAIYQLTRHWAVMGSGGPGLQAPRRAGASAFYASLQFTN